MKLPDTLPQKDYRRGWRVVLGPDGKKRLVYTIERNRNGRSL